MYEGLLTVDETAQLLGVSAVRVRQLIKHKRLKATRLGARWIIELEDIKAFKPRLPGRPKEVKTSA